MIDFEWGNVSAGAKANKYIAGPITNRRKKSSYTSTKLPPEQANPTLFSRAH